MSASLIYIVTSIVAILGLGGTAVVADSAVPGDTLYSVDTFVENVQRALISNAVKESEFELDVLGERIQELEKLSNSGEENQIQNALKALEEQQLRIQERVRVMNQLRIENKLQGEDQVKVMEKLQTSLSQHQSTLNTIKGNLENSGNTTAGKSLTDFQNGFQSQIDSDIADFEKGSGLEVKESESNQGDDSQIQNQNQTQNAGETSGSGGSNSNTNSGSTNSKGK